MLHTASQQHSNNSAQDQSQTSLNSDPQPAELIRFVLRCFRGKSTEEKSCPNAGSYQILSFLGNTEEIDLVVGVEVSVWLFKHFRCLLPDLPQRDK